MLWMVEMIKEVVCVSTNRDFQGKNFEIFQIMKTSISNFNDNLYFNIYTDKKQITY